MASYLSISFILILSTWRWSSSTTFSSNKRAWKYMVASTYFLKWGDELKGLRINQITMIPTTSLQKMKPWAKSHLSYSPMIFKQESYKLMFSWKMLNGATLAEGKEIEGVMFEKPTHSDGAMLWQEEAMASPNFWKIIHSMDIFVPNFR